ncbi:hypothetical protein [Streptomyces sp. NPDC094032]|uniref:hypothetical protein n=1 Tax=Streptomyces sp. NPDC094032 TaxID=3155308 RepID=UPI00332E2C5D
MSKTTTARTALRAAVTSALIVLVTGAGLQTSWADEPVPATGTPGTSATSDAVPPTCVPAGTPVTANPGNLPTCTDNNPWD